jgi:hypothetical protein
MASWRAGRVDDPVWRSVDFHDPVRRRARLDRRRAVIGCALLVCSLGVSWLLFSLGGFDWAMVLTAAAVLTGLFFIGSHRPLPTLLFAVVALAIGFGWLETVNAVGYHTLDLTGPPPKVVVCGRDYLLDPTPVASSAAMLAVDQRFVGAWSTLITPSGTKVGVPSCSIGVTATLLHTPPVDGRWFEYSLSGGP